MLRSKRLDVVRTLEARREKTALEQLATARQFWQDQQQRLQELRRYQADYREQMRNSQLGGSVTVTRLQGWQAFIAQIDQAIAQQERKLQRAQEQLDTSRAAWQQAYERRCGMEKYVARCRDQEQREQDAREQKQMDDAATRTFHRRR